MPPQQAITRAPRRSLETASAWAFILTFIVAFLVVIPSASVPFLATKSFVLAAGALITLALFILARLSRGNVILPPLSLVGALWLPALAYLLSAALTGGSFTRAFWGSLLSSDTLGFMLAVAFLGTLGALIFRRAGQYRAFFVAAAWAFAALVVLQAAALIVGQISPNFVSPSFSLVGASSDLALIFGLGITAILITLRFLAVSARTHTLLLVLGAVALFLLATLNYPLVWILVGLVALALFVEAVMKRRGGSSDTDMEDVSLVSESSAEPEAGTRSLVLPLVVLAVSLFFLIGGNLGGALANALHVNVLSVRPSWQSTWNVASHVYSSSPIFGSGPGTFGTEWLKFRNPALNSTVFWNLDFSTGIGFLPTSFVTTGAVGALAWLLLIGLFLVVGLRALILRASADPYVRYVSVLSFLGFAYVLASAVFDVPGVIVLALGFAFAGIFASTLRYAEGRDQWGVVFSRAPRVGFVIVFLLTLVLLGSVVAGYALVERYVAALDLGAAGAAYARGNLDQAAFLADRSLAFAEDPSAYQIEAAVAVGQIQQVVASTTMPAADAQKAFQSALSNGVTAALAATRVAPDDYQNWLSLGNLYGQAVPLKVQGAYDSAKSAYDKAAALDPTNPQIPYLVAQLDIAHGDAKSAETDLKQAVTLKQDYTAAIFLLSQLYVQEGNLKDALASAEAAAYFTPTDPNVLYQLGVLRAANNDLTGAAQALLAAVSANPQFANAHYFLAAVYAKQGNYTDATTQIETIAAMSDPNASAVATQLAALKAGKNPFPANLLTVTSPPQGAGTPTAPAAPASATAP